MYFLFINFKWIDVEPLKCVITGKVAHYRDPVTGEPYYDLAAYKELVRRREEMKKIVSLPLSNTGLPLVPS